MCSSRQMKNNGQVDRLGGHARVQHGVPREPQPAGRGGKRDMSRSASVDRSSMPRVLFSTDEKLRAGRWPWRACPRSARGAAGTAACRQGGSARCISIKVSRSIFAAPHTLCCSQNNRTEFEEQNRTEQNRNEVVSRQTQTKAYSEFQSQFLEIKKDMNSTWHRGRCELASCRTKHAVHTAESRLGCPHRHARRAGRGLTSSCTASQSTRPRSSRGPPARS